MIFGRKGSGKSFLVKNEILPVVTPYVVVDYLGEYQNENATVFNDAETFLNSVFDDSCGNAILRFTDDDDLDEVFYWCFYIHNFTLIIEEISLYCNPYRINPHVERLVRFGRHKRINIIGVSQRPADVHKIVTSQADALICFHTQEVRDIEYIGKFTSEDANKLRDLKYPHGFHIFYS